MESQFLIVSQEPLPERLEQYFNKLKKYQYKLSNFQHAINEIYTKNYQFTICYLENHGDLHHFTSVIEEFPFIKTAVITKEPISQNAVGNPIFKQTNFLTLSDALIKSLDHFININSLACFNPFSMHKQYPHLSNKLIFHSHKMKELNNKISILKNTNSSILITGESGTGKQVVSRIIHNSSQMKNSPFIELNCATVPSQLLESEFFGYEKGAFSGAYTSYEGKLEAVKDGTLFLDEIGEMDIRVQSKLLNVLERRPFYRMGSNKPQIFKGRIIAATNKELKKAISLNEFRKDLYYRLNVMHLHIPPLRERREDIKILAEYFFHIYLEKYDKSSILVSSSVYDFLEQYEFEGNVRELSNMVERLVLITDPHTMICGYNIKKMIEEEQEYSIPSQNYMEKPYIHDNKYIFNDGEEVVPLKQILQQEEKKYLQYLMNKYNNMSQLAQKLDIERSSLYRKVKQYHLIK